MRHRPTKALSVLIATLLLTACGETAARRELDRARQALAADELRTARAAAEASLAAGEPEVAPFARFLLGNVAYAECELATRQAESAEAEPFAFDVAIRYGETALDRWREAAMSRPDWPAARRNAERALKRLEDLRWRKREAESRKLRPPEPRPVPEPPPDPEVPGRGMEEPAETRPQEAALSAAEVRRLLERLAEKEREKLALRRVRRAERSAEVERDW